MFTSLPQLPVIFIDKHDISGIEVMILGWLLQEINAARELKALRRRIDPFE